MFRRALFVCAIAAAGAVTAVEPDHRPLELRTPLADKNFYLLSALGRDPAARNAIRTDPTLARFTAERISAIQKAALTCDTDLDCNAAPFRWSETQIEDAAKALAALPAVRALADGPLRRNGVYIRYDGPDLVERGWRDCIQGLNRVIDLYAMGAKPRYPLVDSMAFDPKAESFRRLTQNLVALLSEESAGFDLPYSASLRFATELLILNRRDEAARHEPLDKGENAAAFERVKTIDWSRYPYTVILVPGSGNDRSGVRLSAAGHIRDEIAARRFREGKAPFVLVSGGYVHPNQTEYAEALEMKRELMDVFHIPADAILVDPHARHTTTNIRNAARLLWRYGIPFDRKALLTTDLAHSRSIESEAFAKRCVAEIGYMPFRVLQRVSRFDLEFLPLKASLQIDPIEPLDP